jgi:flagellar basal-body rod modification protein FlgD
MSVGGIESAQTSASQNTTNQNTALGKDEFLTLLVAQLQHQDPMNPMDSTGFTAQLAQFSSLEQLQNVNDQLGHIGASQAALNNSQAVDYIGKTVVASGSSTQVNDGVAEKLRFDLSADAARVDIKLYDAAGNFIRSIENDAMNKGQQSITWDGTDMNGNVVPDGTYTFQVMALDANQTAVSVSTYTTGLISGVNFRDGSAYLLAGDIEIPMSSVVSVTETQTQDK